jgi:hypothetical protein
VADDIANGYAKVNKSTRSFEFEATRPSFSIRTEQLQVQSQPSVPCEQHEPSLHCVAWLQHEPVSGIEQVQLGEGLPSVQQHSENALKGNACAKQVRTTMVNRNAAIKSSYARSAECQFHWHNRPNSASASI